MGKHSLGKCDCTAIWDLINRINPKHLFAVSNNNGGPAVVFNHIEQIQHKTRQKVQNYFSEQIPVIKLTGIRIIASLINTSKYHI